jgi:hypothetical protein
MSAAAPLGSPSRNTGNDEAVCTSAISVGEVVSDVITHAAATSFIHMHTFDAAHTSHSIRNVGSRNGAHADWLGMGDTGGPGSCSDIRVPRFWI